MSIVENVEHFYTLKTSDSVSFLCIGSPEDGELIDNFNAVAESLYSSISFYSADRYAIPNVSFRLNIFF